MRLYHLFFILFFWGANLVGPQSITPLLHAQCPPQENMKGFIDTAEVENILVLAEKLADCPSYQDSLGYLYHQMGIITYLEGDLLGAIRYTEKASNTRRKAAKGYSLNNLGNFYSKLEDYDRSILHFKKAIQVLQIHAKTKKDSIELAENYTGISKDLDKIGDYETGLNYAKLAIQTAQKTGNERKTILAYDAYGTLCLSTKKYKEAVENALAAKEIIKNLPLDAIRSKTKWAIDNTLGIAYYELQDYSNALNYHTQAREFANNNAQLKSKSLNNMALTHLKMGNERQAVPLFQLIIAEDLPHKSYAYNNLGDIYLKRQQYAKANSFYKNAVLELVGMKTLNPSTIIDSLSRVSDKEGLLIYARSLAKSYTQSFEKEGNKNYLQQAQALYFLLDNTTDFMRTKQYNRNSKLFWRDEVHPIYEEAIAVSIALNQVKDAFYFSEKSKAILLYDRVSENLLQVHLADSLQQQLHAINRKIDYLASKEQLNAEEQVSLLNFQDKKTKLLRNIEQHYPVYYELKYQPLNIELDDALSLVSDNQTLLLEYFYGKNAIYAFQMSKKQGITVQEIGLTDSLKNNLEQFTTFFREDNGASLYKEQNYFQQIAYSIFNALLPKNKLTSFTKIILIPDGYLNNIPFDALLTAPTKNQKYDALPHR